MAAIDLRARLGFASAAPARLVFIAMFGQIVLWTIAPTIAHTAPPLDIVEGAYWGREGLILSHKHPNLPGLLIQAAHEVTGAYGWPEYLLSQLFVTATYWIVYLLGRDLFGPVLGAAGALVLTGCYYFSWPTPEFNHNVAQMPFWAGIALLLWRAAETNALRYWALLGFVAALGMYAKFSVCIVLLFGGVWLLADRRGRDSLRTVGPWLCLVIFVIGVAPLAFLLVRANFLPLTYAAGRAGAAGAGFWGFVGAQIADNAGLLIIIALTLLWPTRHAPETGEPIEAPRFVDPSRATWFLALLGIGPFLFTLGVAATFGAQDMWTAPMFNLAGLLALAPLRARIGRPALRRIAGAALSIIAIAPIIYVAALKASPYLAARPSRMLWPEATIAKRMVAIWDNATHAPLRIVGGDTWVAGLVGLDTRSLPILYASYEPQLTPWVTPERLAAQGALLVWEASGQPVSGPWDAPGSGYVRGQEVFDWSPDPTKAPLTIDYVVVPPVVK